ncbi:hypothetical protein EZS27_039289 [termite gut metagenome]|uniref:Transposase IS4-like domain-containing protein n=1 Tax=termite gut metagenome TaxID=433724 RepID=A0A5J4PKS0_9ZZZZ
MPELLDLSEIKGSIVTLDAMGTQRTVASKIVDREGDCVLAVKDNQKTLREEVEAACRHNRPAVDYEEATVLCVPMASRVTILPFISDKSNNSGMAVWIPLNPSIHTSETIGVWKILYTGGWIWFSVKTNSESARNMRLKILLSYAKSP